MSGTINKIQERDELKRQLESLDNQIVNEQKNCSHDFPPAKYDPEIERVPSGYKMEGHGSDVYPVATGYMDKDKPRWSRTCKKCGKTEYTYTQKPTEYKPDFGK
jgi:hypothetical protein